MIRPRLIGWNRSPYVRRVAISLNVLGIEYEQEHVNAWDQYGAVRAHNPIAKVPALIVGDGETITESWAILDWIDEQVGPDSALMGTGQRRAAVRTLTALAGAITDKSRELRYERNLRPKALRFREWIVRWESQITSALDALEGRIGCRWAVGESLSQADITIFCMAESLIHNHPHLWSPERHPTIAGLHRHLSCLAPFRDAPRDPAA